MNPVQTTLLDKSAFTHVGTGICLYESWLNCTRPVSIWMCMCGHTQLCPTLCNPMDCSPPGSSVHWILQARILEWVPIYNFRGSSWPRDQTHVSCVSCTGRWILHCFTWEAPEELLKVKVKSLSRVRLFATPWTVAYQAPPSMGFFRQEYWSGFPFPSPGDLPNPGVEPRFPALEANALTSEPPGKSF